MVTGLDIGDGGPDSLHDTSRLMTEDRRRADRVPVLQVVKIAVTQTGRRNVDNDFSGPGTVELNIFDCQRLPNRPHHRGFHETGRP